MKTIIVESDSGTASAIYRKLAKSSFGFEIDNPLITTEIPREETFTEFTNKKVKMKHKIKHKKQSADQLRKNILLAESVTNIETLDKNMKVLVERIQHQQDLINAISFNLSITKRVMSRLSKHSMEEIKVIEDEVIEEMKKEFEKIKEEIVSESPAPQSNERTGPPLQQTLDRIANSDLYS